MQTGTLALAWPNSAPLWALRANGGANPEAIHKTFQAAGTKKRKVSLSDLQVWRMRLPNLPPKPHTSAEADSANYPEKSIDTDKPSRALKVSGQQSGFPVRRAGLRLTATTLERLRANAARTARRRAQ